MLKKTYTTLEFDKILEQVSHYALSPNAKKKIQTLEPFTTLDEVTHELEETSSTVNLVLKQGTIPLRGIRDITDIIKRLQVSASLSISELLKIADLLRAVKTVKSYYNQQSDYIDTLIIKEYFSTLDTMHEVYTTITRCIVSEEEIADDASQNLNRIRKEIRSANSKVKGQIHKIMQSASSSGYLQDSIVTMRNNRYCLPVKAEHKSHIKGMVHDQSSTGSTVFIEPIAVVEMNNKISALFTEEQKEIERILMELSAYCSTYHEELLTNSNLLTHLDFLNAKAEYSLKLNCTCPSFNDTMHIHLNKARHPMLDPKTVVPSTVYLGEEFTTLVITGPNTGGKTVTLKTLGLLSLMGQSGLHIPAKDNSKLTMLEEIYADIGDEQSIEQSLSTFSSHMTNITSILKNMTLKSLVLFDELGAGTDPTEGAALAMAILDHLRKQRILTAATTHYSELKVYALSTDFVENASCEFDVNTLRPTYRLLIGVPGKSNAFAISKRLGLDDFIIEEAKELLEGKAVRFEDLITDLENNKKIAEIEKEKAERYKEEARQLHKEVQNQKDKLKNQRDRLLGEAKQEAYTILEKAKDEADSIIRSMNKIITDGSGVSMSELENRRSALRDKMNIAAQSEEAKKKKSSNAINIDKLHMGDTIFIHTLGQKGSIININKQKKEVTVQMGIMKTKVPITAIGNVIDDMETTSVKKKKSIYQRATGKGSSPSSTTTKAMHIRPEIDLRGTTIDEALNLVDKYLDDAYLSSLPQVTLIHGKGTGVLRQGIHNYLRKSPHVKSYRLGEFGEGESGVTIVEFK